MSGFTLEKPWFPKVVNLERTLGSPRRFSKTLVSPSPRGSDTMGLGRGLRICISNKFPGDDAVAGLGTTMPKSPISNFKKKLLYIYILTSQSLKFLNFPLSVFFLFFLGGNED